jgi:mannose-6-phosphate isomerase-like protein (cupin superfamily)
MHTPIFALLAALSIATAGLLSPTGPPPRLAASTEDVKLMLDDFVTDYRSDRTAVPMTFGIEIRSESREQEPERWHVVVGRAEHGSANRPVELIAGFPEEPMAYFTTDVDTLRRLHDGRLASLTAMGKEFSTDYAPLDMQTLPGFQPDMAAMQQLVKLGFHFWTRGFPERVPFGKASNTRLLHGAHGTLFYYQEGFRSGFFMIQPGDHVNDSPVSQVNPFPTLFILTEGRVNARIGETECEITGGEAIYIGPDVSHEFWIDEDADAGAEGIIVMFGDGA